MIAGHQKPQQLSPFIPSMIVKHWCEKYARTSAYCHRLALKRLCRFIEQHRGTGGLVDNLPRLPAPHPRTQIATTAEVRRLIETAEPWMRLFLLCCTDLLLRAGTAARLAPAHYHVATQTIRVDTKGGAIIELPISPAIAALFSAAPPSNDPLRPFWQLLKGHPQRPPSTNPKRPHGLNVLRKRWARLKKQCGVQPEVRLHDLRRTAAVRLMDTSKDIRIVSHALGHQSLASTAWYLAHRDPEKLRKELLAHWWTPRQEPIQ